MNDFEMEINEFKNDMSTPIHRALHYVECYELQFPGSDARQNATELRAILQSKSRPTNIAADFVCPLVCPQCKNTAHYFDGDGVHCWFCEPLNR